RKQPNNAGWSSPVARQAHNLKVAGSNPAPATKQKSRPKGRLFCLGTDTGQTPPRHPSSSAKAPSRSPETQTKHQQKNKSLIHTRMGPFAFVTPAYEKQKPRRTNSGAFVVPAGPETYAVSDRTRPKVETISSTISSSTIKGGESARISPVTRTRKPAVLCDLPVIRWCRRSSPTS
ncbi:hypothetical protein ACSSV1_000001, partial [Labrenzia sp. MBR-25]